MIFEFEHKNIPVFRHPKGLTICKGQKAALNKENLCKRLLICFGIEDPRGFNPMERLTARANPRKRGGGEVYEFFSLTRTIATTGLIVIKNLENLKFLHLSFMVLGFVFS